MVADRTSQSRIIGQSHHAVHGRIDHVIMDMADQNIIDQAMDMVPIMDHRTIMEMAIYITIMYYLSMILAVAAVSNEDFVDISINMN